MDRERYLAALASDSGALLAVAAATGPSATVPSCPDWTVADLAWHVAEVHWFWATNVRERPEDPMSLAGPERPGTFDEIVETARRNATALHEVLSATDPATPVRTWSDDHTAAFVLRRMAHETMVHRLDAELAAGRHHRLDPELASDGIDEFLTHFLPAWPDARSAPLAGSVHLHCTDVAGEWVVRERDGAIEVTREHAKGDAAVRGPAGDLLQVLWRRIALDAVDVVGDAAVAGRLVARTSLE